MEENIINFAVSVVPHDGLVLSDAGTSAGTVKTKWGNLVIWEQGPDSI